MNTLRDEVNDRLQSVRYALDELVEEIDDIDCSVIANTLARSNFGEIANFFNELSKSVPSDTTPLIKSRLNQSAIDFLTAILAAK